MKQSSPIEKAYLPAPCNAVADTLKSRTNLARGISHQRRSNSASLASLPDHGWGELILTNSEPRSGTWWTDSGSARQRRELKHRGFKVYPSEVEQIIWTHPAVQDCAVIGVPHEDWGEAVTAVVELNPGAELIEAELIAYCREQLGGIKTPKSVVFADSLPRSANGKVLKKILREPFWRGHQRKI